MGTYTVTVTFLIGDSIPQSTQTIAVRRKAKDATTAIATVTAVFSALSNATVTEHDDVPYIQVIRASTNGT